MFSKKYVSIHAKYTWFIRGRIRICLKMGSDCDVTNFEDVQNLRLHEWELWSISKNNLFFIIFEFLHVKSMLLPEIEVVKVLM